jgi:hypothetical protein
MTRLCTLALVFWMAAGIAPAQQFPGVPPPVPAPGPPQLPPRQITPTPTPPTPQPGRESFGDRVIRCNHAFPLGAGQGNDPTDRDAFVRSCAN